MHVRHAFAAFALSLASLLGGASITHAQCAATACAGPADCLVDGTSGTDAPGCCATGCKTIQFAVGDASAGDVIKVAAGTYPESLAAALNITKTVTLCGAQAGVDARTRVGAESIITDAFGTIVSASNVVVDGFTFQGVTSSIFPYGLDMAQGTAGTQVYNNIFQNNIAGIGLANAGPSQVLICQNLLQNNNNAGSATGSGIYTDEFVCGSAGGIRPCTNFTITDNAFKGNVGTGSAGAAINLSYTDPIAMTNVDIGHNTFDMNARAILLFNVDSSTIHNNTMTNSTLAGSGDIRIFGAGAAGGVDGLTILSNAMSGGAGWAIRMTDGANTDIQIHLNNIANYAGDMTGPNPGGLEVAAGAYPSGVLDATCNWWNDPCGPYNVTNNPTGPGEEVREGVPSNVDFISWLIAAGPAPASGNGMCSGSPGSCQPATTTTTTTSTSTSTIPQDHFQCYEVKPAFFPPTTVTAQDQFGTQTLGLRFPHRMCAPANKNGEGIPDPTEHLTGYPAKPSPFTKQLDQVVTDQFGTLHLDVTKPALFMVPTAKNGVPIAPPVGDHFTCYKVKPTRGTTKFTAHTVTVVDQFETLTLTAKKPYRLCAPANKNGEDPTAPSHTGHLLCYKSKSTATFGSISASISNQFGPDEVLLIHRRELCVPATKNAGSSTTTTSTSSTTTTTNFGSPSAAFVDRTRQLLD